LTVFSLDVPGMPINSREEDHPAGKSATMSLPAHLSGLISDTSIITGMDVLAAAPVFFSTVCTLPLTRSAHAELKS